jgi:hypothetical protein
VHAFQHLLDLASGSAIAASRLSITGSMAVGKGFDANLRALAISSSERRRMFSTSALARR